MDRIAIFLCAVLGAPCCIGNAADAPAAVACLSSADAAEAVGGGRAVEPARAIAVARAAGLGEILRVTLCREEGALVYRVAVLGHAGRLTRVTVDASSGTIARHR